MALLTAAGYLIIITVHTALTVVLSRFFRLQLDTTWGTALYVVVLIPLALVVSTMVLGGLLGFGGDVGGRDVALTLTIALPLSLGLAIDLFWLVPPEEVELPETT